MDPAAGYLAVDGEDAAVGEQVAGLKQVVRGKLGEAAVLLLQEFVLAQSPVLYTMDKLKNKHE